MLNKFAFCAIVLMVFAVFLGCPDSQKESDDKAAEVESTEKTPEAVVKSAEDTEEKATERKRMGPKRLLSWLLKKSV